MKERPIIFKGEMVRAILSGQKTQTRRIVKGAALDWLETGFTPEHVASPDNYLCPQGFVGDRLWVRETWAVGHEYDHLPPRLIPSTARVHYAASEQLGGLLLRPSIFMPRWASRINLEITDVRIERLNEISEKDALAEGVLSTAIVNEAGDDYTGLYASERFANLWVSINGSGSWDLNPWVWVIEFKKVST